MEPRVTFVDGFRVTTFGPHLPNYDAFHSAFPASAEKHILHPFDKGNDLDRDPNPEYDDTTKIDDGWRISDQATSRSEDPLFNLPTEVSDLVLSYLSPAALDAARHTSKLWRQIIMSNCWVLAEVLNRNTKSGPQDFEASSSSDMLELSAKVDAGAKPTHRDILRELDHLSRLPSTYLGPDTWRTRFRIRNLEFSIGEGHDRLDAQKSTMVVKAVLRIGSQNGFMIFQTLPSDWSLLPTVKRESTLFFFRFNSNDFPIYAGSVQHPGIINLMEAISLTELQLGRIWRIMIKIGDAVESYRISVRDAFSKFDARHAITKLAPHEDDDLRSKSIMGLVPRIILKHPGKYTTNSYSWMLLASFPTITTPFNGVYVQSDRRYLAEHVSTGNIMVVQRSRHFMDTTRTIDDITVEEDDKPLYGAAILLRPQANLVYRNIAIAPMPRRNGMTRVAILWQNDYTENKRPELYIYDICESSYYSPWTVDNHSTADGATLENADSLASHCKIQGQRVTSLGYRMGGIHPQSQLWSLRTERAEEEDPRKDAALGGLQFPHTESNQETSPQNLQYQRCFVWGPSDKTESKSINCKVFDFSFADPLMLHEFPNPRKHARTSIVQHLSNTNHPYCACRLHDDSFRITLPPLRTPDVVLDSSVTWSGMGKLSSPFWPWKQKTLTKANEYTPTVTPIVSEEREEAIERKREYFRERIRYMKRSGMSDFDIAEQWGRAAWTRYGQYIKPDGWRDL